MVSCVKSLVRPRPHDAGRIWKHKSIFMVTGSVHSYPAFSPTENALYSGEFENDGWADTCGRLGRINLKTIWKRWRSVSNPVQPCSGNSSFKHSFNLSSFPYYGAYFKHWENDSTFFAVLSPLHSTAIFRRSSIFPPNRVLIPALLLWIWWIFHSNSASCNSSLPSYCYKSTCDTWVENRMVFEDKHFNGEIFSRFQVLPASCGWATSSKFISVADVAGVGRLVCWRFSSHSHSNSGNWCMHPRQK